MLLVGYVHQAVWVWTVSLPVTVLNACNRNPDVQAADIIGWILWFVGFVIEAVADQQKLAFKNNTANKGKWCDAGLWGFTRHPNYFGEVQLFSWIFEHLATQEAIEERALSHHQFFLAWFCIGMVALLLSYFKTFVVA